MRTYAEVAIKVEPITAMRLLREYRNYKILGAHGNFFTYFTVETDFNSDSFDL